MQILEVSARKICLSFGRKSDHGERIEAKDRAWETLIFIDLKENPERGSTKSSQGDEQIEPREYVAKQRVLLWRVIKGKRSRSKRLRTEHRSLPLVPLCSLVSFETIVPVSFKVELYFE